MTEYERLTQELTKVALKHVRLNAAIEKAQRELAFTVEEERKILRQLDTLADTGSDA